MSVMSWLLWLGLSAAVMVGSLWHYRRRETPGRGRALLAVLRGSAVALALLLLFDPELPTRGAGITRGSQVLLDASLSMRLQEGDGTRWDAAVAEARSRAGDRPVLLFGDRARPVTADALPDSAPGDGSSRLLPALQAAAEAGVRDVVVLSDGGIEDADAVARWAPRLGLGVEMMGIGEDVPNTAVIEAAAPQWVEAGEPLPVEFAVAGGTDDSVAVVVRRDGRVLGRTVLMGAAAGRIASGSIEVRLDAPATDDGWARLEVALENGDAVPDDDVRTLYVQVGAEPAGIVLVSFRPDWEPRFMAPVLERSLGLPLRAWIRGATGRYVRLGSGLEAGNATPEDQVRTAAGRAQVLVLHGLGVDAPAWAHGLAASAARVLILPADELPGDELPVQVSPEMQGDFFLSGTVPASPVAPLLADVELAAARPLTGLRTAVAPASAWAPLNVTRGRQGTVMPLALAGQDGRRRWVVSLGSGYWQWAFRGGAERQVYDRLWSALGGWLAQEGSHAGAPAVRPAALALPRARPLPWITPAAAADSIHVLLTDAAGNAALDTVVAAGADTVFTNTPAPGHYSYRARAFGGDTVTEGAGVLTVERYSPEFARRTADSGSLESGATAVRGGDTARRGTPLHATPYPYVLIVLLLAVEWILRRRWGLR